MADNEEKKSSSMMTSFATPFAIIIAGFIIGGAVLYTNGFSGGVKGSSTGPTTTASTEEGPKYQKMIDLASGIGLDSDQFSQCMDKFDTAEIKDDTLQASTYGVNGTPAFFIGKSTGNSINGVKIGGAYPIETFKGVIDGINDGNDQGIINAIGPDQDGNLPSSVAAISQQIDLGDDPVKGDPNAPITIIEFSDYECPFCQRHFQTTYPRLETDYINTGKAKLVFRDLPLPFHDPIATQAAVAANCARAQGGDDAYFKYHDAYYSKTQANGKGL